MARHSPWMRLGKWLISDPWRKIVSLGLATGCWFVINLSLHHRTDNQRWETVENVPVTLEPSPATPETRYYFDAKSITPREVALAVAVDAWSLGHLNARNFRVRVQPGRLQPDDDLMRTQPLEGTYTLRPTDLLEKPDGVMLRSFLPTAVTFKWDYRTIKSVPVTLKVINQLPDNLDYRNTPLPQVQVMGPAFLVNQIAFLETEPILLNQAEPGHVNQDQIRLQLPSRLDALELDRHSVPLNLEVIDNQRVQTRHIQDIRLNYLTNPDSALVLQNATQLPRNLAIYVSGPAGLLEKIDPARLMAICDLTTYSMPGPQDAPVQVMNLPPGLKVTRISPASSIRVILAIPPQ